jgi:hypothetical protein
MEGITYVEVEQCAPVVTGFCNEKVNYGTFKINLYYLDGIPIPAVLHRTAQ